jgi:hypothetical protein
MSIEAHLPRKWLDAYTATKWYRLIVRNQVGFEDERLKRILLHTRHPRCSNF